MLTDGEQWGILEEIKIGTTSTDNKLKKTTHKKKRTLEWYEITDGL